MRIRPIPFDQFTAEVLRLYDPPHRAAATRRQMRSVLEQVAALEDPRFRDPVAPLERVEAPAAAIAEPVDQAAAELAPGPADPPRPPIAESWGSVHASGPRKMTAAVLTQARELRQAGWSWPAIARKFGCHRMAFYHALRRPPQ